MVGEENMNLLCKVIGHKLGPIVPVYGQRDQ